MKERKVKTRIRRKNMGIKRVLLLLILIFIAIQLIRVIVPATITFSRYVYAKVRTFYFATQEFFFTSDKLASGSAAYFETTNWDGIEDYEIRVNMFTKNNSNEGTTYDVDYDIIYSYSVHDKNGVAYTNPTELIDFYISKTEGTVLHTSNNRDFFDVVVKTKQTLNDDDYIKISIKTISKGPYIETLMGEFKIGITNLGMNYAIDDNQYDQYLQLTVTNTKNSYIVDQDFGAYQKGNQLTAEEYMAIASDADKEKCHSMNILLTFDPDVVVIDTTSGVYLDALEKGLSTTTIGADGKKYVNSVQFHIDAEESKVIKFYKKDISKDYTYPTGVEGEVSVVSVKDLDAKN